jgi:hypothetical protein
MKMVIPEIRLPFSPNAPKYVVTYQQHGSTGYSSHTFKSEEELLLFFQRTARAQVLSEGWQITSFEVFSRNEDLSTTCLNTLKSAMTKYLKDQVTEAQEKVAVLKTQLQEV